MVNASGYENVLLFLEDKESMHDMKLRLVFKTTVISFLLINERFLVVLS